MTRCEKATTHHVRICKAMIDNVAKKKKQKAMVEEEAVEHVMEDI